GIRDKLVTGVQTCALPISGRGELRGLPRFRFFPLRQISRARSLAVPGHVRGELGDDTAGLGSDHTYGADRHAGRWGQRESRRLYRWGYVGGDDVSHLPAGLRDDVAPDAAQDPGVDHAGFCQVI